MRVLRFLNRWVNGMDVEPGAEERRDFAFSCRIYRSEGAPLSGRRRAGSVTQ
jgi:hypothetical protein